MELTVYNTSLNKTKALEYDYHNKTTENTMNIYTSNQCEFYCFLTDTNIKIRGFTLESASQQCDTNCFFRKTGFDFEQPCVATAHDLSRRHSQFDYADHTLQKLRPKRTCHHETYKSGEALDPRSTPKIDSGVRGNPG